MRPATAPVSSGAMACMSASRLAMVTESWWPLGRSATRARMGSGRLSWRRRLWAFLAEMPRSAQTAATRSSSARPARAAQQSRNFLLVGQAEFFALVLLGLDAADLVRGGGVVEQQDDQAVHRGEAFQAVLAGELVAGLGGKQPALAGVDDDSGLGGVGLVADAGHELAGAAEHAGEPFDAFAVDVAALVGGQVEVFECDAGERAVGAGWGDGGDVEQRGLGPRRGAGVGHVVLLVGRVRCACAVRGRRCAGR